MKNIKARIASSYFPLTNFWNLLQRIWEAVGWTMPTALDENQVVLLGYKEWMLLFSVKMEPLHTHTQVQA